MEATQKKIGAQIAALRRAKGLTQEQLAEMLGVSAPAVSKWETDSSYPDITLLCPLARALGTNLDTLLQFEEDLPDKEVIDRINALMEQTLAEGSPNGWKMAEEGLEELLCRWPGCALLLYNGAAVYDTLRVFFPGAGEENFARWRARKRNLLERVRASGNAAYWQSATVSLAGLEIAEGEPEKGAALLRELPEQIGDPTFVWVQYHLKQGEDGQALERAQKQLYRNVSQTLTCLGLLANPRLMPGLEEQQKIREAYKAVARAFGFLDTSDGFLMEWYLRQGQAEKAAECFAAYVEALAGPAVYPSETLFSPGLGLKKKEEQMAAFREMRRMLWEEIQKEERCRPMRGLPAFEKALEKLGRSLA